MSRRYGKVRPKGNHVYSVDEVLDLYEICRNTLTNWTKSGLRPTDALRPQLFRGAELARFHADRSERTRRQLKAGEFKCVCCKLRVVPDVQTLQVGPGRTGPVACATCPECDARLFRLLDATAFDAYQNCLKTNTSLHTLHEYNGRPEAGVGTKMTIEPLRWNPENERIVRGYQDYCGRYATETKDAHLASIRDFEAFVDFDSLRKVKPADASRFREELARRGREGSSRSSITHRASQLRLFFTWLVQQDGYRSLNHSIPSYLELSRRDTANAIRSAPSEVVSMDVLAQVLQAMSIADPVARRDRAVVAATCLFGTRANATASLLLGDVDLERRVVMQDATRARIKNSKSQVTKWFLVGEVIEGVVVEWIEGQRRLGFQPSDALFPPDAKLAGPFARSGREPVQPWATEDGVRRAFHRACAASGLPYINPHAVKHALTALGRDLCRTTEEEMAWSHNLGHESLETTRSHYAKMTDARRDSLFNTISRRDPTADEDKDLLLRYHEYELQRGTPEFEKAQELHFKRMERRQRDRTESVPQRMDGPTRSAG